MTSIFPDDPKPAQPIPISSAVAKVIDNEQARAINPLVRFVVTENRRMIAMAAIHKAQSMLTMEQALNVIYEIGYGDQVGFGPNDKLEWDLTDLQIVAFAASLAAVAENGGQTRWSSAQ